MIPVPDSRSVRHATGDTARVVPLASLRDLTSRELRRPPAREAYPRLTDRLTTALPSLSRPNTAAKVQEHSPRTR